MSCNNTNNTCTSCNHNYSSCNNKCAKCGCRDSFLTSPPPCPTPQVCPDPIPCQEVLSSDCIIYNGPNILCNNDIVVYSDATWTEILEDIVAYFCLPPIPEILCGEDIVVTEESSINDALEDIVSYFCDQLTTANNGLTMSPTSNNVQLGGPLIQNTTLTNSTFNLNINSTTVPALTLDKTGTTNATLVVNNTVTSSQAILANSNISGLGTPVVQVTSTNTTGLGTQALGLISNFNSEQIAVPLSTIPTLLIQPTSTTAAGTTNACGIRVENRGNTLATSGVSIEFANTAASTSAVLTNRLISKTVINSSTTLTTSEFIIQGKPSGTVNPVDHLTLKSTGQLQLNNYGSGLITGVPTYNLSTTAGGNVIETVAGSEVTLSSAGGIVSLVNDGTGPTLAIKGLTAGTGIAISSVPGALTISATLEKAETVPLTGNQTIIHNLGTTLLVVSVVQAGVAPLNSFVHGVDYTYVIIDPNTITITEVVPGALGSYQVCTIG